MTKEKAENPLMALKAAIRSGQVENLYFFHGEETFLLHHYLQQLKNSIVEELTESFNFHRFNSENFDLESFANAVENLPMMAERTMVQLEDVDIFQLAQSEWERFAQILSDIPEYCTVVFCFEIVSFKQDAKFKKLCQGINCQTVEFAKQSQRDLVAWIQRHFTAQGKRISPELCVYLIEITDGTMTALSGEIRKIAAFSASETICRADIDAVTEPVLDAEAFRMTDQMTSGAYGAALVTLQKLLKMQEEPLKILGAVGGHFRRLALARILLDHGKNYTDLMKLTGSRSDYGAKKSMEAAKRIRPEFCAAAMTWILETDHQIKTSRDDSQRLLEMLILRLAQEAEHG